MLIKKFPFSAFSFSFSFLFLFLFSLLFALFLSGCSSTQERDETVGWSAQKIYSTAKSAASEGLYEKSAKYLERLEARYPYGRYAQQAQLELCYVWWKADEIANALAACDRFLKLHPNHPNADYIYYLKGLINFKEDLGFVAYLGSSDPSERDSDASKEALNSFAELLRRYPNSKYAPDAQKRVLYLVNALAQKEIHVAKYYIKRQAFLAAANRAQQVLKDFPNTPSNEEALYIMVVAYKELGLRQLHDDTLRIMQQNFPDSKYFKEGLFADKKWWHLW